MKTRERLVILDTHAILHRAYHALPDFSSSKGEPTGALYGLISMLVKLITDLKPDYIVGAFDLPGATYRHVAFEKYKAHRKELDDALALQIGRSRDVLKALGIPLYECEGFEADDVIGTIVEKLTSKKDVTDNLELIIASGDMDTLQLVDDDRVRAYTLRKGLTDTVLYDAKRVVERYGFGPELIPDYKGLRGDASDNIPGVRGIGEKTATILISQFGSIESLYKTLKKDPEKFEAAGVKGNMLAKLKEGEEDAKFSKMLAEIRRDAPIEFTLPKPWREEVSQKDAIAMMQDFDFRSLIPRVKTLLGTDQPLPKENGLEAYSGVDAEAARGPFRREGVAEEGSQGSLSLASIPANVSQEELDTIGLAVYVLDSNITQPTLDDIYRVGKSDDFAEAKKNILAEIKERGLSYIYEQIELPLYPVLRTMEKRGVKVDKKFLADLSKKYTKELESIAKRIYGAAGEEFNINSPKQLGDILFDKLGLAAKNQKKTAGGQRSTRESELEKLRELHPIIADILAHRELSKLLGTYIDTLPTLLDSEDRVHTTYIQTGAATGRIASHNPNLQNIPIKTELGRAIRHAFVASDGMQLVSFDYSQIELRIAAFLSGDQALSEIFANGRDVHREVGAYFPCAR
jgi:DNA polymerase-1